MKRNKLLCWAAALSLCLSLTAPARADANVIYIRTASDLAALSEHCRLDAWSEGKTVVLTADIDLTGVAFQPIPIFRGRFEGNNHTIRGLNLTARGSRQGLFRTLEAEAYLCDLTVEGVAAPGGSASSVGLLAGENAGTIYRCAASGTVVGTTDVGGLVGVNTGVISLSASFASVTGVENTGGIAGRNTGTISGGSNSGEVNTTLPSETTTTFITNTGGIAGNSDGKLEECRNYAQVGYPHTGYNAGGIVGLSSGSVLSCYNEGTILGRKDVGGIIGQLEPYVELTYALSPIETLSGQLTDLTNLLDQFADQLGGGLNAGAADLADINNALDSITGTTQASGETARQEITAAVDTVYLEAQTIHDELDTLLADTETFTADADTALTEIRTCLTEIRGDLDTGLTGASDAVGQARDDIQTELDRIDSAAANLQSAVSQISADLNTLETFLNEVSRIAQNQDMEIPEKLEALRTAAGNLEGLNLSGSLRQIASAMSTIQSALSRTLTLLDKGYDGAESALSQAWRDLNQDADRLDTAAQDLQSALNTYSGRATASLEIVNSAARSIGDTLKTYYDGAKARLEPALDSIYLQLDEITAAIDRFTSGLTSTNGQLGGTVDQITAQLNEIWTTASALNSTPSLTLEDISDLTESGANGWVLSCENSGTVQADLNVGGVAGIAASELLEDPEEDFTLPDALVVDTTAVIQAVIFQCSSDGEVWSKNGCAGGILGRGDVGAVLNCTSAGWIESEGAQCGGVAGLSRSIIRGCSALCDLTGTDYVGGIAGQGRDIRDCRTIVRIDSTGECLGAIAGCADGEIWENYFVQGDLAGIDGVDYAGKAVPLDYNEFSALEDLPRQFLQCTITFRADGRLLKTVTVPYGGSLSEQDFPLLPEKAGYYAAWPEFDWSHIVRSITAEAVYTPLASTISSGEVLPLALAEGTFPPDAALILTDWQPEQSKLPAGYRLQSSFTLNLSDGEEAQALTLRVRWDAEAGDPLVLVERDGALTRPEFTQDGSYLVFSAAAGDHIAVLSKTEAFSPLLLLPLLAVALLLVLFLRRRHPPTPQTAPPSEQAIPEHAAP